MFLQAISARVNLTGNYRSDLLLLHKYAFGNNVDKYLPNTRRQLQEEPFQFINSVIHVDTSFILYLRNKITLRKCIWPNYVS